MVMGKKGKRLVKVVIHLKLSIDNFSGLQIRLQEVLVTTELHMTLNWIHKG